MNVRLINQFFGRPYGGIELEVFLALVSVTSAVITATTVWSLINVKPLIVFYGSVPTQVVAVPWFLSGVSTLVGLWLFARGNLLCIPLRLTGAAVAFLWWTWLFFAALFITAGEYPTLAFYFWSALANVRIAASAAIRWHSVHAGR